MFLTLFVLFKHGAKKQYVKDIDKIHPEIRKEALQREYFNGKEYLKQKAFDEINQRFKKILVFNEIEKVCRII